MKNMELPRIGSRNIKTGIAVLICLLFWRNSLFAAIAAVICMQDTVENSLRIGKNRLIGTLLGGVLGLILLSTVNFFSLMAFLPIVTSLGVIIIIYCCNVIKKPAACSIASIILIGILVSNGYDDPLMYSIRRTVETAFGVVVAILINMYVNPPEDKDNTKTT
ncbi:FUSC family protein [Clostridium tertium]|uniref:Fusaric acid resistance protein family protein n=2 Tax=Clostridium tertium TaxID=1559 RepID=A0A6N3G0Q5_9CLOT